MRNISILWGRLAHKVKLHSRYSSMRKENVIPVIFSKPNLSQEPLSRQQGKRNAIRSHKYTLATNLIISVVQVFSSFHCPSQVMRSV